MDVGHRARQTCSAHVRGGAPCATWSSQAGRLPPFSVCGTMQEKGDGAGRYQQVVTVLVSFRRDGLRNVVIGDDPLAEARLEVPGGAGRLEVSARRWILA